MKREVVSIQGLRQWGVNWWIFGGVIAFIIGTIGSTHLAMSDVLAVAPDVPLDRAVDLLVGGRAALVLRDGELIGQISPSDVARWANTQRVG